MYAISIEGGLRAVILLAFAYVLWNRLRKLRHLFTLILNLSWIFCSTYCLQLLKTLKVSRFYESATSVASLLKNYFCRCFVLVALLVERAKTFLHFAKEDPNGR